MRRQGAPVLLVDSGDFLFARPPHALRPTAAARAKAEMILRAYRRMGYDAVLPGDGDFSLGLPFLLRSGNDGVPFTCLNLVSARQGKPAFAPFRSFSRGGIRIVLTGLLGEDIPSNGHLPSSEWKVLPPRAALEAFLSGQEASSADLVILLTRLGRAGDLALARAANRPLLIFGARSGSSPQVPAFESGAAVFPAREKGTHLLEVSLGRPRGPGEPARSGFVDDGRTAQYRKKRQRLLDEMNAMEPKRRQLYEKAVESIDNAIRVAEVSRPVSSRMIPLDSRTPSDPEIEAMLSEYKSAIARIARKSGAGGRVSGGYLGHAACAGCHARIFAAWRNEAHARAYETLRKTRDGGNPDCIGCHVTGYEAGGLGLADPRLSKDLAGVGCEACHGPGKGHPGRRMAIPGEKTCAGCHGGLGPFPFPEKRRLLGCVEAAGGATGGRGR